MQQSTTEFNRWLNEQVKSRWPSWCVMGPLLGDWYAALIGFDVATLTAAVRRHRIDDDPSRPKISRVRAIARSLCQAPPVTAQGPDVETNVFVECLTAPAGRAHWAGVRKGVYVVPTSRQDDPDVVRAAAEHMRKRFEQIYGGQWITVVESPRPVADDGLRGAAARVPAIETTDNEAKPLSRKELSHAPCR